MAIRLRPRNQEELVEDADFADCVELQPEVVTFYIFLSFWTLVRFLVVFVLFCDC